MLLSLSVLPARITYGAEIFGAGSTQFAVLAGSGSAFNNDYLILGGGVSYYVSDGVGVGLTYENWSGNSPRISQISPSIQYVFYREYSLRPYVGAFYRDTAIAEQSSINSVGGRAGVYLTSGPNSVFGVGLAYESYLNCQAAVFGSCSSTYPEISIIFGF